MRENSLLKRLQADDMSAFDELYEQSYKNVYMSAYVIFRSKEVAEDITQETFLDLLEKKHKIKKDVDLIPYLITTARNKSLNLYNRSKKEQEFANSYRIETYSNDEVLNTGLLKTIESVLSEKEFMVFVLKVLGEYSFKEIAKITKLPIGSLTWTYQEARKKLEEHLKGAK